MNRDEWNPSRQITNDAGTVADIMHWLGDSVFARIVYNPCAPNKPIGHGISRRDRVRLDKDQPHGWRLV